MKIKNPRNSSTIPTITVQKMVTFPQSWMFQQTHLKKKKQTFFSEAKQNALMFAVGAIKPKKFDGAHSEGKLIPVENK